MMIILDFEILFLAVTYKYHQLNKWYDFYNLQLILS